MRKSFAVIILLILPAFIISAQGIYFDIGFGYGFAITEFDGIDVSSTTGYGVDELAADIDLKLGYGPIASVPLYFAGEFSGYGHRFYDSFNYIQFNSYLIGPSVIFYPISSIQLSGAVGYSFVSNITDFPVIFYDSIRGIAWNISIAADLGKGNNAILLGLKYANTINTLEVSGAEQYTSILSIFIRYAYRKK